MHPILVPLGLLFLANTVKRDTKGGPSPTPPPGGTTPQPVTRKAVRDALITRALKKKAEKAEAAIKATQPIRSDPYPVTVEHPDVIPSPPQEQAAVDATMAQVIRDQQKPTQPTAAAPAAESAQRAAATRLMTFLIKTGRFGSAKDKPAEVKQAQKALGVKADGIVGPKTRAASLAVGVALPPKP